MNDVARRPARRVPTGQVVAEYWAGRGEPFLVDADDPRCFGCGRREFEWPDLERAHLIDRACDGLDHEANIAMLCRTCHSCMPMFENGQIEEALDYAANARRHIVEYLESRIVGPA